MRIFNPPHPVVLLILDGWSHSSETRYNAISGAKTPCWNHLMQTCPHTLLDAFGYSIGLLEGQMGNSEVGHLTSGEGHVLD